MKKIKISWLLTLLFVFTACEADKLREIDEGFLKNAIVYPNGGCAYECSWGSGDCIWNLGGEIVDGTCGANQACCYTGEPAADQCTGTCMYTWEAGGLPTMAGNCSDIQKVCVSDGPVDTGVDTGIDTGADTGQDTS
ncbi:MAG: hypothetical protein JXR91_07970, partial [Deltaproteobacteria bacterium]|nr:hypothetical protein [Deltaproteobacteria bacterium]